jgi:hypothetical protein
MIRRIASLCLLVAIAVAPAALAQDMPMGQPEEMKAMEGMAGHYKIAMKYKMDPTAADWSESEGTAEYSLVLDGCAMKVVFKADMMGRTMTGHQYLTYNRMSGKWQSMWTDDMGAYISYMEGDMADGKMVLLGEESMMGQTIQMRSTTENITDGGFDWKMEMSMDGTNWMPMMMGSYSRVSGEKAGGEGGGW